jgi:hypothetical protein
MPQETGAGAFFPAKAAGAVKQAWRKPFEPDRNFGKTAAQLVHDPIYHAAADQGLADCSFSGPIGPVRE